MSQQPEVLVSWVLVMWGSTGCKNPTSEQNGSTKVLLDCSRDLCMLSESPQVHSSD